MAAFFNLLFFAFLHSTIFCEENRGDGICENGVCVKDQKEAICGPGELMKTQNRNTGMLQFARLYTKGYIEGEPQMRRVIIPSNRLMDPEKMVLSKHHYLLHVRDSWDYIMCEDGDELIGCEDDMNAIVLGFLHSSVKRPPVVEDFFAEISGVTRVALCRSEAEQEVALNEISGFPLYTNLSTDMSIINENHTETKNSLDFIIVGTQKGGTTSLWEIIRQHPNISAPYIDVLGIRKKLINYDEPGLREKLLEATNRLFKGISRNEFHYFNSELYKYFKMEDYLSFFDHSKVTGEKTPGYMCRPDAAARIAYHFSNVKIIILVRDPASRLYSAYHMLRRVKRKEGTEEFEDYRTYTRRMLSWLDRVTKLRKMKGLGLDDVEMEAAVGDGKKKKKKKKKKKDKGSTRVTCDQISRGLYAKQVDMWYHYFPPENIMLIKSEDYFKNGDETVRQVFDFLGVEQLERIPEPEQKRGTKYPEISKPLRRITEEIYSFHNEDFEKRYNISWGY